MSRRKNFKCVIWEAAKFELKGSVVVVDVDVVVAVSNLETLD